MKTRIVLLTLCLVAGSAVRAKNSEPGLIPNREPLTALPLRIGQWVGRDTPEMSDRIKEMLALTDYTSRNYVDRAGRFLGLYIGYHAGGGFHSPLNCLPGAGWNALRRESLVIPQAATGAPGRSRLIGSPLRKESRSSRSVLVPGMREGDCERVSWTVLRDDRQDAKGRTTRRWSE